MNGYVYILTNPSFRDDWVKIGKSSRPIDAWSQELDNASVPLPFEIYAVMKTEKYIEAEEQIHGLIDIMSPNARIRQGREFFNMTPEKAFNIFKQCARTIDDAEIEVVRDNEPKSFYSNEPKPSHSNELGLSHSDEKPERLDQGHHDAGHISYRETYSASPVLKRDNLTFEMLNIPVGAELTFSEDRSVKATVVNELNTVRLQDGIEASLSGAVVIIKRRLGTATNSEAYQGGVYWMYKGKRLTEIRRQIERGER